MYKERRDINASRFFVDYDGQADRRPEKGVSGGSEWTSTEYSTSNHYYLARNVLMYGGRSERRFSALMLTKSIKQQIRLVLVDEIHCLKNNRARKRRSYRPSSFIQSITTPTSVVDDADPLDLREASE